MAIPGAAVAPFLPKPDEAPDPRAPGPFAFAEDDYVRSILSDAGWRAIAVEPIEFDFHLGESVETAMNFMSRVGPVSRGLAELEGEAQNDALAAAEQALTEYAGPHGVSLRASIWLVTAFV